MSIINILLRENISKAKQEALVGNIFNYLKDITKKLSPIDKTTIESKLRKISYDLYDLLVEKYDPTSNGKYMNWLVAVVLKEYQDELFDYFSEGRNPWGLKEDGAKIKRCLQIFHIMKDRKMLSGKEADINTFKSSKDLYQFIKPHLSNPDFLGTKKEVIMKESDIIYDDGEWKIVVPKTYRASCFWGTGTNWCTAVDDGDESTFKSYNEEAPLYIFIEDSKQPPVKYQMHWGEYDFQFMDEDDEPSLSEFYNVFGHKTFYNLLGCCIYYSWHDKFDLIEFLYDLDAFVNALENDEEIFTDYVAWDDFLPPSTIPILLGILSRLDVETVSEYQRSFEVLTNELRGAEGVYNQFESVLKNVGTSIVIDMLQKSNDSQLRVVEREIKNHFNRLMK